VTGGWRRLCNEELYNLYTSEDIIWVIKSRGMRWTGHVVCIGKMRNIYKSLVGKPLRRPRHRWKNNIRMVLREIWWEGVDSIYLAQDRGQW
jgi:hypothetical protein